MAEEKKTAAPVRYVCECDLMFRNRWYPKGSVIELKAGDVPNHSRLREWKDGSKPIADGSRPRDLIEEQIRNREILKAL